MTINRTGWPVTPPAPEAAEEWSVDRADEGSVEDESMDVGMELEDARREVARIRAGGAIGLGTEWHLAVLLDLPRWSPELDELICVLRLALFSSSDRMLVERVITGTVPFVREIGWVQRPLGLILRAGDPVSTPFPGNPWGIPPTATLDEAITCVWGSVAAPAAGFVAEMRRRLLGLALYDRGNGSMVLKYLVYREKGRYEVAGELRGAPRPPFDRRHARDWEPFGELRVFYGDDPVADPAAPSGLSLPSGLRARYGVHGLMGNGMWDLIHPNHLARWNILIQEQEPTRMQTLDASEARMSDDLVMFFASGGSPCHVFDLAGDGPEPLVRYYDGQLYPGEEFWSWFADHTALLLGMAQD
jgi:hypothetical protein